MRNQRSIPLPTFIRDRRKCIKMSQSDLAEALGVARNTVTRWEKGEVSPPFMIRLALRELERSTNGSGAMGLRLIKDEIRKKLCEECKKTLDKC